MLKENGGAIAAAKKKSIQKEDSAVLLKAPT